MFKMCLKEKHADKKISKTKIIMNFIFTLTTAGKKHLPWATRIISLKFLQISTTKTFKF